MLRLLLLAISFVSLSFLPASAEHLDPNHQLRIFGNRMVGGSWYQKTPADKQITHSYQWALGKSFLVRHEWNDGEPNALTLIGIDPATNSFTWWAFREDGQVAAVSFEIDRRGNGQESWQIVTPNEPDSQTRQWQIDWQNDDKIEINPSPETKIGPDGKPTFRSVWERSKEVADLSWVDAEEPKDLPPSLSFFPHLAGEKWIEGSFDGTRLIGGSHGKWILDGKFLIVSAGYAFGTEACWSHIVIFGADPETGKGAEWEFTADGSTSVIERSDDGMSTVGHHITGDGKKAEFRGKFSIDGDVVRYTSDFALEGEKQQPYGWNWHPVK